MKKFVVTNLAILTAASSLIIASPTSSSAAQVSKDASIQLDTNQSTKKTITATAVPIKYSWGYSARLSHIEVEALIYAIEHKQDVKKIPWVSKSNLPAQTVNALVKLDPDTLRYYDKLGNPGLTIELHFKSPYIKLKG